MKFLLALSTLVATATATIAPSGDLNALNADAFEGSLEAPRDLRRKKSSSSKKSSKSSSSSSGMCGRGETLAMKFTNLTPGQIFAPQFFVAVHDDRADPIYVLGEAASSDLEVLAEDGDASDLVSEYDGMTGVESARPAAGGVMPGASVYIEIDDVNSDYPLVSMAVMAVVTNDAFVAMNAVEVMEGGTYFLNGLDAGTEVNDEDCANIPGPPCGDTGSNGTDEDFVVHIHSGIHGTGADSDLDPADFDWRNPMAVVRVMCVDEDADLI